MQNNRFKPNGQCYFLPAGHYCEILRKVRENELGACYPERGLSMVERMTAHPYVPTIVTEDPYLVALYSREFVFVWNFELGCWTNPDYQTYGGSISSLTSYLFENRTTIPLRVLSEEASDEYLKKVKNHYSNLK